MAHRHCPVLILACVLILAHSATADEGMWPPYSLGKLPLAGLNARGLTLSPEQIYKPGGGGLTDAVVQVGATASFVSADGLLITNHHVAYGAVQEQSTPEHNYLRDGFSIAAGVAEIEAPGYSVNVTTEVEDVTTRVLARVNDKMTGIKRYRAIDQATKRIVAEAEKGTHLRCRVVPMFGGRQYIKYTSFEIRDVRLVYVPPEAIGNYGGETDNWMWPRHTGDFAFLRAYVGPDGKPADYSRENLPYHPKTFLPISSAGVAEGDLTMTIGFPGRTARYISSYELENQIDFTYPNSIRNMEAQIGIIEEMGQKDSVIALRTANDLKGLYNRLKKNRGIMEGFQRTHTLDQKREEERQLSDFLAANPALRKQYGSVLPALAALYAEQKKTQLRDTGLERLSRGSDFFRLAAELHRLAVERDKPEMEREKGYQSRDTLNAKRHQRTAQINLIPSVDRALFQHFLQALCDLPPGQKVEEIERLFAGKTETGREQAVERFVTDLFARTKVGNLDDRLTMFSMSRKQIESLKDPFIDLATALYPAMEEMRERGKAFDGAESLLGPQLVQAYAAWRNGNMYPDANGSMRISFGEVRGFGPRDAVTYHYHTLLAGVMQKESGQDPFIVPPALRMAYEKRDFGSYVQAGDNDVPVDFLTTNDITNGNSGSPVLNGKGEIVGLAFDGNYESVASDYLYDPEMNRTIVVDARYILFLLDKVYHLDGLRNELTIR